MEARDDPVRKAVREFGTQSVSEDDGTRMGALSQCEYVRFLVVAQIKSPPMSRFTLSRRVYAFD